MLFVAQAALTVWEIGLVTLGGAVVGGTFAMLGEWREGFEARKARREERAAEDRAAQRRIAERLMREMIDLYAKASEVAAASTMARRPHPPEALAQIHDRYAASVAAYLHARLTAKETMATLADEALRARTAAVIDTAADITDSFVDAFAHASQGGPAPDWPVLSVDDAAPAAALSALTSALGQAARGATPLTR